MSKSPEEIQTCDSVIQSENFCDVSGKIMRIHDKHKVAVKNRSDEESHLRREAQVRVKINFNLAAYNLNFFGLRGGSRYDSSNRQFRQNSVDALFEGPGRALAKFVEIADSISRRQASNI